MTTAVLVPVDGSPMSDRTLSFVADNYGDASVHLIHVLDHVESSHDFDWTSLPGYIDNWTERMNERGEELLEEANRTATAMGLTVVASEVVAGRPATEIVRYESETDVDHIVMGTHGRKGLSRFILGSVAEQVLRRSSVPVTIVR